MLGAAGVPFATACSGPRQGHAPVHASVGLVCERTMESVGRGSARIREGTSGLGASSATRRSISRELSHLSTQWYISGCLSNELIGLEATSSEAWKVYFGWVLFGVLDPRNDIGRGSRHFGVLVREDGNLTGDARRRLRRR